MTQKLCPKCKEPKTQTATDRQWRCRPCDQARSRTLHRYRGEQDRLVHQRGHGHQYEISPDRARRLARWWRDVQETEMVSVREFAASHGLTTLQLNAALRIAGNVAA